MHRIYGILICPGLNRLDGTQRKALRGIIQIVADIISDMKTNNELIPVPLSTRRFSGKFISEFRRNSIGV